MLDLTESLHEIKKVLLSQNFCNFVTFGRKPLSSNDYSGYKMVTKRKNDFVTGNRNFVTEENFCNLVTKSENFVTSQTQAQQGFEGYGYKVTKVTVKNNNINFTKSDWLELFDERAAIYQYENGDDKTTAEVKSFDECILKWMEMHSSDDLNKAVGYLLSCGLRNPFYRT